MKNKYFPIVVFLIAFVTLFSMAFAKLETSALFSDGMVLQQQKPIKVWGWADQGAFVKVEFAKKIAESSVDSQGKWIVELPAQMASKEAQIITITSGDEKVVISDVLVGEVWLASGQSNMEWTLRHLSNKTRSPQYQSIAEFIKQEATMNSDPLLRQIAVPKVTSFDEGLGNFKGKWVDSKPVNNPQFSGTAYFFAKKLRRELDVPVGIILSAWGGTHVEPWIPNTYFTEADEKQYYENTHEQIKQQLEAYQKSLSEPKELGEKVKVRAPRVQDAPASLYNGMINPLVSYGIKGVIWYQGESNASAKNNYQKYAQYFGKLIMSWREVFNQGDFSFYYCQLAGYSHRAQEEWLSVCNQQRQVLTTTPHTGMAVLNDIGQEKDIHPRNKIDAGKRLALWALAKDYGRSDLVYSGPLYKSYEIKEHQVIVSFDNTGSGLQVAKKHLLEEAKAVDEPLYGFELCGEDGLWHPASAKISGSNQITVSNDIVAQPKHVRYGWQSYSDKFNLYNKEGLPTSLFTTK